MNKSDGAVLGAFVGAVVAGTFGQIPPLTALPEEIISVPALMTVGAILGGELLGSD